MHRMQHRVPAGGTGPAALPDRVESWVDAGIITDDQADRILAAERAKAPAEVPRRISVVSEALGNVGGTLVVVSAVTIGDRYRPSLAAGGRLAVALGSAAVLLGVAWPCPPGPARPGRGCARSPGWPPR